MYFQKVTNNIVALGSLIGEFNIQYRANSSSAWTNIDSVTVTKAPDPTLDTTWLASQSIVSVPANVTDNIGDQYGYRYKFDQIGEYRILCKTSGSNGPDWGWYITYSDGTYVGSAAAPCIP